MFKHDEAKKRKKLAKKNKEDVSPSDVEDDESVPTISPTIDLQSLVGYVSVQECEWKGIFDWDNAKSPVTVCDKTASRLDKMKVSCCVNHTLQTVTFTMCTTRWNANIPLHVHC